LPASLTKGIADLLASILATAGQGTVATDIFIGVLPDSPDDCFVIIDTSGTEQNHSPIISAGFQLLVRDKTRSEAESKIHTLRDLLRDDAKTLWPKNGSGFYIQSAVISEFPFSIGVDVKGREKFSVNGTINCRRKVS